MKTPAFTTLFRLGMLAALVALLLPRAAGNAVPAFGSLTEDIARLSGTSSAERRLETYGDTDIMGYGYLTRILEGIPEDHLFPLVRYPYYGMNAEVVFPGLRTIIDPRILVGISLQPEDLQETVITEAVRIGGGREGRRSTGVWLFSTTWEYDTLNGFRLELEEPLPENPQHFRVKILYSPDDRRPLRTWEWLNVTPESSVHLKLPYPLKYIYGRGSLPYVVVIQNIPAGGRETAAIKNVEVTGIKVDLEDYAVIHTEPGAFTAVDRSFLTRAARKGSGEWHDYLKSLTNVADIKKGFEG